MLLLGKYKEPHVGSDQILLLSEFRSDMLLRVKKTPAFSPHKESDVTEDAHMGWACSLHHRSEIQRVPERQRIKRPHRDQQGGPRGPCHTLGRESPPSCSPEQAVLPLSPPRLTPTSKSLQQAFPTPHLRAQTNQAVAYLLPVFHLIRSNYSHGISWVSLLIGAQHRNAAA